MDDGYQYVSFYAPLVDANGRYRLGSGKEQEAPAWQVLRNGRGFAVRYVNSTGLHDLIRSSTRIVDLEHATLSPVLYTSIDIDGGLQTRLALFENGRLIHDSVDFGLQSGGRIETVDNDMRNIPDDFRLNIVENEFVLKGTIDIERFLARVDPVNSLKPFVRAIVKLLNTPIQYWYLVRYDLEYTQAGKKSRLQGLALMDHLVLRRERRRSYQTNDRQ